MLRGDRTLLIAIGFHADRPAVNFATRLRRPGTGSAMELWPTVGSKLASHILSAALAAACQTNGQQIQGHRCCARFVGKFLAPDVTAQAEHSVALGLWWSMIFFDSTGWNVVCLEVLASRSFGVDKSVVC